MILLPSKLEMRSAVICSVFFAFVFLLFTLPMFFSDAVSVTVANGFTGVKTERVAPGNKLIAELLLIPVFAGVVGCVFGIVSRRRRQFDLWKASDPDATWLFWRPFKLSAVERFVYRLNDDGTDA